MQQFRHRRALSRHQNERQKTSAVISGDFDGALTTPLPRLFLSPPVGGRTPQGTGGNPVILEPDLYKQKQPCLLVML